MNRNPNCEKCTLHLKAQHVCMEGRWWNKDTDAGTRSVVAFVGTAPGKEEDEKGMPFVGPAGQLLQQAVNEFKLQPAYFTSTVRCFPGRDNKGQDIAPSAGQVAACAPYMESELTKLKPKYLVAVGGNALKALTGKSGITAWAGQIAGDWKGIPVFAMLHPSYILRKNGELPRFEAHAKALAGILRPQTEKPHPKVEEKTPKAIRQLFERCKSLVAFDYETTGLSPWEEGAHIRTVSFSLGDKGYWMRVEGTEGADEVLEWFLRSDIPKAAQNAAFECVWSLAMYGVMPHNLAHDTQLLAHLADENGPKSLDLLASRYLGAPNWDIAPTFRAKGWTWATAPIEELGPYNGLDAVYTAQLVDPLLAKLNDGQKKCYTEILLPLAQLCARMQFRGMHVDKDWATMAIRKYTAEMAVLDRKIRATHEVQKLIASLPRGRSLNYRSSQQMSKLLFGIMKLPVGPMTDSGEPSTSNVYLERIKNAPPLLDNYLSWKERETVIGKYLDKFPKYADDESVIHAPHNPARIVTGRTAVSEPPIHGTPKGIITDGKSDGFVRGMFNSRFSGGQIMSSDYKALEFRLVCSEAGEKQFIDAFVKGLDPHALTATDLFGKNFTPYDRDRAKITNFSLIYGVTEYSLAPKLGMTEGDALKLIIKFKKAHPDIFLWMERQYERVRREKIAVNRFGRVRHLPDVTGMKDWQQREVFREAGNFPIQSGGADITNLSAIEVDRQLRDRKMKSKLVLIYHDALICDVHPKEVPEVESILVKTMQEDVPGRLKWLRLPLTVDLKKWDRWEGAKAPVEAKCPQIA